MVGALLEGGEEEKVEQPTHWLKVMEPARISMAGTPDMAPSLPSLPWTMVMYDTEPPLCGRNEGFIGEKGQPGAVC